MSWKQLEHANMAGAVGPSRVAAPLAFDEDGGAVLVPPPLAALR